MTRGHTERLRSTLKSRSPVIFLVVAVVLLAVTCLLHFWRIGAMPPGFYGDECSLAYNAYCIGETGADEYGIPYPMFFRAFDVYHDPVIVYALVPFIKILGLHQGVARFPSALFAVLAALAFGLLVQEYCRNRWLALLGLAVFSVTPWMFAISRTVSSYNPMLLGMVLGWWLLLLAFRKRRPWLAVGAGLSWAFAMYADNVGRPMTVLWLGCFALAYHRLLRARWKVGLAFVLSYVGAMVPMMVSVIRFPEQMLARFKMVGSFRGNLTALEIIRGIAARYLDYFSPRFLLLSGDPNLRQHTGFGGELSWFTVPLILAGAYPVLRFFRTRPQYRFLVLALLTYPAAAALTTDRMHGIRCVNGAIAWLLLAMLGARWLWQKKAMWRKLLVVIACAGAVEVSLYLQHYFGPYQRSARFTFQGELADALTYCFQHLRDGQVLSVSAGTWTPYKSVVTADLKPSLYTYVLFYGKIDPRKYQRTGFPMETIQLYDSDAPKPGLLLRCNYFVIRRGDVASDTWVISDVWRNLVPVPTNSVLLKTIPFAGPTAAGDRAVSGERGAILKTIPFAGSSVAGTNVQYEIVQIP